MRTCDAYLLPHGNTAKVSRMSAQTLADRAWLAYHALPRDSRGRPPSRRSLERAHVLPGATLAKLFGGFKETVEGANVSRLARALGVSSEWLFEGTGAAPVPTGPVPMRQFDAAAWRPGADDAAPSSDPHPRRFLAVDLAREDGVGEEAIASVLAEPVASQDAGRSRVWWVLRMRRRELDIAEGRHAPAAPASTEHHRSLVKVKRERSGRDA